MSADLRDHTRCCFSTDLEGNVTAGRGKLGWDGQWEFPCDECAERIAKKLASAWPTPEQFWSV